MIGKGIWYNRASTHERERYLYKAVMAMLEAIVRDFVLVIIGMWLYVYPPLTAVLYWCVYMCVFVCMCVCVCIIMSMFCIT